MSVAVCIPTIPPRKHMLQKALASVMFQELFPDEVIVQVDNQKRGAGPTRTAAMMKARTKWIAFLDDDDQFKARHLERLVAHAEETGADVVYPWFDVCGGNSGGDPFPQWFGAPWDPANPHIFPITALVRAELAQSTHGFPAPPRVKDPTWNGDDYPFWLELNAMGAKIVHLPERTWDWWHWGGNTSGLPERW